MTRKRLPVLTALLMLGAATTVAQAQSADNWPNRPIKFVVGFGPGGGTDIIARMFAQPLAQALGQPIVIENKPGAGGTVAAGQVARAAPDGYTAFIMNNGHAVSSIMYRSLPFHAVRDFAPVSMLCEQPLVVVAGRNNAPRHLDGLITRARAQPGVLNFASVGVGSTQHFAAELFKQQAGINMVHVPYKGTPQAVAATMGGEVDMLVEVASPILGQIRSGDLTPLAVTSPTRFAGLPDVPTAQEAGLANYNVTTWYGVAFPAKTPKAIVDRMNAAIQKISQDPNLINQAMNAACQTRATSPADFERHLNSEISRWEAVRKAANIEQQ